MSSLRNEDLLQENEDITRVIGVRDEVLGPEELITKRIVFARQALDTEMAFLFVLDSSRSELTAYLSLDRDKEPPWQKIQWKAGAELETLFTDHTGGWETRVHGTLIPMLGKGVYDSSLLRPLSMGADKQGIFGVAAGNRSFPGKEKMALLEQIAESLTLECENRRLENSTRWLVRAIDANIRFTKYLASQTNNLELVLEQVFDELKDILNAESCGVLFYDPERKELILQKPSFGLNDEQFQSYTLSTERPKEQGQEEEGIGVAVKVFLTGEPYICNIAENDQVTNKRIARIYGARSSLSVPLVVNNERIGVLHVINKRKGDFSDDDARLLELLAGQLAIVIENARLLRQMEQKNDLLRHSMEIHNRLTRMVLREREMSEIIRRLAKLIGRDVIVQDHFFKVLGSSLQDEDEAFLQIEKAMAGELWQVGGFGKLLEQLVNDRQTVNLPAGPRHGLKQARLIAPITLSNNIFGYVSILENKQRPLGELDYLAIEHAVTVFTLKMMQQKIAYDVAERIKGDFLNDLLSGNFQSSGDMLRRASYLGYDFSLPHQVLYVETNEGEGTNGGAQGEKKHTPGHMQRSVFDIVNNSLKKRLPGSMVVSMKDEAIVAVLPVSQQKSQPKPEELAVMLKDAMSESLPDLAVLVGIGRVCNNVLEINNSYQEARRSISIARKLNRDNDIVSYDSLGVYKLLFAVKDGDALQQYATQLLGPILKYDRDKNDILLPTLRNYLLCNCNNQKAADSLFIHLNTLKYRLQKIQDICNVDLSDAEERLNLQLALKVLEIKNV